MFFYIALWGLGDGGQVDNKTFSIYNISDKKNLLYSRKNTINPKK